MAVRLSALCAGHPLPPGIFLVLISVKRLSRPQGHNVAGRVRYIEKIHLIGISMCVDDILLKMVVLTKTCKG
jgi:hypothetical protein